MKQPEPRSQITQGDRLWRRGFFVLSATMGGYAMVDLDAGRVAGALGNVGVACLMLSLMPQFPFLRAVVAASGRAQPREELLRELDRVRVRGPWVERVSGAGWLLLGASFVLRLLGVS